MDEFRKTLVRRAEQAAADYAASAQPELGVNMGFPRAPSLVDVLQIFNAEYAVKALAKEIDEWKAKAPKNHHLVVTMRTPDGRVMDVAIVRPVGFQAFAAEGFIQGMNCMISGHISSLSLFCSYEETKSRTRTGFIIEIPEPAAAPTEPQPVAEPVLPGSEKRSP